MSNGNGSKRAVECSKCSGKGILSHHKSVDGGRCYGCHGTGKVTVSVKNIGAIKPRCMSAQLEIGDGSGKIISAISNDRMRPVQLATVARLLGEDAAANVAEIAAVLAVVNYPKATDRARAYFAGQVDAFDAAFRAYRMAIESDPEAS